MTDPEREELRLVAERLMTIAETRAALQPPAVSGPAAAPTKEDCALASIAEQELERRALRPRYLPADLFGEGAWTILLDLFVSEQKGRQVSVTSACYASQVPATTALRHIALLIEFGLVSRSDHPIDKRVKLLSLTSNGLASIRSILQQYSR